MDGSNSTKEGIHLVSEWNAMQTSQAARASIEDRKGFVRQERRHAIPTFALKRKLFEGYQ